MGIQSQLNGYVKWLSSTKFQICLLTEIAVYIAIPLFNLEPEFAVTKMVEVCAIYCATRVLEPIVEFIVKKLEVLKNAGYKIVKKNKP